MQAVTINWCFRIIYYIVNSLIYRIAYMIAHSISDWIHWRWFCRLIPLDSWNEDIMLFRSWIQQPMEKKKYLYSIYLSDSIATEDESAGAYHSMLFRGWIHDAFMSWIQHPIDIEEVFIPISSYSLFIFIFISKYKYIYIYILISF